jgi:hypothetical protein
MSNIIKIGYKIKILISHILNININYVYNDIENLIQKYIINKNICFRCYLKWLAILNLISELEYEINNISLNTNYCSKHESIFLVDYVKKNGDMKNILLILKNNKKNLTFNKFKKLYYKNTYFNRLFNLMKNNNNDTNLYKYVIPIEMRIIQIATVYHIINNTQNVNNISIDLSKNLIHEKYSIYLEIKDLIGDKINSNIFLFHNNMLDLLNINLFHIKKDENIETKILIKHYVHLLYIILFLFIVDEFDIFNKIVKKIFESYYDHIILNIIGVNNTNNFINIFRNCYYYCIISKKNNIIRYEHHFKNLLSLMNDSLI